MWPEKNIEYVKLKDDSMGRHFGLFVSDELVSVISIFDNRSSVQFRKFATLQELQGKGYGTKLLNFVLEEVKVGGAKALWCNARRSKVVFYKGFGLEETGETATKEGIEYVTMSKNF